MNLLQDIITYVRRIIKSPSDSQITNDLLIDYINRFWIMDVDARIQLFDLKTKYQFQTTPGMDQYNMPLYNVQTETLGQDIALFPVYQGFTTPAYVAGVQVPFYTDRNTFLNYWPNYVQVSQIVGTGTGSPNAYTFNLGNFPILPGHVDITGIIFTGNNVDPIYDNQLAEIPATSTYSYVYFTATGADGKNIIVADSGQFLSGVTNGDIYGLLMTPGKAGPTAPINGGNKPLPDGGGLGVPYAQTQNTINYNTGVATNVYFNSVIPAGVPIYAQCCFYAQGLPRAMLYFNNTITLRAPPDKQYLVEVDAYLTPAAFLSTTGAIPFGYMAEYIARGAARKILADTGDIEQFQFYEPLFREQELLVWKRSQRQNTSTRVPTIYSQGAFQANYNQSSRGF